MLNVTGVKDRKRYTFAISVTLIDSVSLESSHYRVSVIWKVLYPAIKDDSLVSDCFPEPPTPTNITFPRGWRITRDT